MTKLSCVIPAYNEAESLPHLWARLAPVVKPYPDWEILIVSDGSTDRTVAVAADLARQEPRLKVITLRRNRGKSIALMNGFAAASGDIIVTLDADLQDDPQEIPNLIAALEKDDLDLVGGWKQRRQDPLVKKISSKVFNWVASRIAGQTFHDLNCGLKAYRRELTDRLDLYGDLYRFIPILAVADGFRVAEIPVRHHPRQYGTSKYGLRLSGFYDLLSLSMIARYRWRPLHFFGRWGLLFGLAGLIILAYLTGLHFRGQAIGDRPLLLLGVLLMLTGTQLFFTGLLGDLITHHRRHE